MFPVIVQIGPIVIYSYWLFAGIGFLCGVLMFTHLARIKRLQMNFIYHYSFSIFLWGLVGARLLFVFRNFPLYFPDFSTQSFLSVLYIWDKGLSLLGALIGILVSLVYFSYKENEQTKKWLDILTISIISGLVIGNIGAFLDGSSYGRETNLPWGMVFESPSIKYAVPIHPVQLYAALYSLIIVVILYFLYRKKTLHAGKITIIGIFSYFTLLFLEGFLRGDDVFIFLGIREEQWLSIAALFVTGSYLISRYNRIKEKKSADK